MVSNLTFDKVIIPSDLNSTDSGIDIFLDFDPVNTNNNQLWLRGRYQIPSGDAAEIKTKNLLKALVITWVSDGMSATKNLVGNTMVFDDDEALIDDYRVGYFNYNLKDWMNTVEKRNYYITVSLDKYISNTISLEV